MLNILEVPIIIEFWVYEVYTEYILELEFAENLSKFFFYFLQKKV